MREDEPQDARERPRRAGDAGGGPWEIRIGWSGEHLEYAQRVGAMGVGHRVDAHDVAARLAHAFIVLAKHETLIEQAQERLVAGHESRLVQYFIEESRVHEVQ